MEIKCPDSGNVVPPEHYNISTDILISPFSGKQYKLSELIQDQSNAVDDLDILSNPPSGLRERRGAQSSSASVSTRSLPTAIFFTPFTLFWNGITSVFVVGPWLGGMTSSGGGPAPRFGVDPFMTLFLTPFILVGIGTFITALLAWAGRFSVTVTDTQLKTFRGIGPIGLRRRFDAASIQKITVEETSIKQDETPMLALTLWVPEKKKIALGVGEVRQRYIAAWLRNELGLNS